MSSKSINIGVVGLGFMAATHIKSYQQLEGARVAALCNPSGKRLDGDFSGVMGNIGDNAPLKMDMRGVKATKCFEDLLNDPDIHVIDICAPTSAHASLAISALAAGKHVLCEKPLARSVKVAAEIVAAAAKAKTFFMPAMCVRFWPETAWIQKAIRDQAFGKVLSASFRRVAEPPAWGQQNFFNGAESGGALFDLHIHDTDFVHYCFGRPSAVTSVGYTKFSGAVDHVVTRYDFPSSPAVPRARPSSSSSKPSSSTRTKDEDESKAVSPLAAGAMVHAEGGWAMTPGFGFSMSCLINFETATVDYDLTRKEPLRLCVEGQPAKVVHCEGPDGYVRELIYFIECIATGQPPKIVTAQDGLTAVEICEAEEKSVRLRQTVSL